MRNGNSNQSLFVRPLISHLSIYYCPSSRFGSALYTRQASLTRGKLVAILLPVMLSRAVVSSPKAIVPRVLISTLSRVDFLPRISRGRVRFRNLSCCFVSTTNIMGCARTSSIPCIVFVFINSAIKKASRRIAPVGRLVNQFPMSISLISFICRVAFPGREWVSSSPLMGCDGCAFTCAYTNNQTTRVVSQNFPTVHRNEEANSMCHSPS